jgi:cell division septation protein DedD
MNRVSIYQIPVASDVLQSAVASASVPPALLEPLQSMVGTVVQRAAETPLRIYLCSEDDLSAARDGFAYAFVKSLCAHVPSTLLVDCDFLKLGLHGLVPQPDALGLLDFLLYGSSIGVVTQESPSGVRVVAAGSFPVTKRMPFVVPAFTDAARRLTAHARCVVFVGPLSQEDGNAHPLASEVDLVVVVRGEVGARRARGAPNADAIEELIAGAGVEVWSVRSGAAEPKPAPPPAPAPRATARPVLATSPAPKPQTSSTSAEPARARPRPDTTKTTTVPDVPETRYGSLLPRVAVLAFAFLVIGFVAWWMWQGRTPKGDQNPPQVNESAVTPVPEATADTVAVASADSMRASETDTLPASTPGIPAPIRPADTGGRSGGTVLVDPNDILIMDDLAARWNDWYAIHISSFQESIRAREEVSFLQSREFPVFIVFLDLGAKGKWYRVYAGPFETREEARDVKKNLDAIPQVRFTRITKIPE